MHWLLFIGWAFYFFVHSFLAAMKTKDFIAAKLPSLFPYYRMMYNVIAILGLLILLPISLSPFVPSAQILLGGIVVLVGFYFLFQAFRVFNIREFLGLESEKPSELVIRGMYRYVRHPLYFGTMIMIAGIYLLFPTSNMLIVLMTSYVYIFIGSKLEERKLRELYGESYQAYAKKVKSLIPYVY